MSRYRFIRAERATYPIAVLCRVLRVARFGYDARARRGGVRCARQRVARLMRAADLAGRRRRPRRLFRASDTAGAVVAAPLRRR